MNLTTQHPAAIIDSDVVTLIPWTDNRKDAFGHDLRSAYVEQFWLGTLGPSTTWFLRHCAAVLEDTEDAAVSLRETACALGIGFEGGARSAMVKTVARACRFRPPVPWGPQRWPCACNCRSSVTASCSACPHRSSSAMRSTWRPDRAPTGSGSSS